jgi:predicted RNase H-like nuclease (RuvC/YqgF family)
MASRSRDIRKRLTSTGENNASIKDSLKELDRMSIELIDKLFEVNARIEDPAEPSRNASQRILRSFRRILENMRFAYQEMYTL